MTQQSTILDLRGECLRGELHEKLKDTLKNRNGSWRRGIGIVVENCTIREGVVENCTSPLKGRREPQYCQGSMWESGFVRNSGSVDQSNFQCLQCPQEFNSEKHGGKRCIKRLYGFIYCCTSSLFASM